MDANTKEVLLAVIALASPVVSALSYWYFHRRDSGSLGGDGEADRGGSKTPPKQ